MEYKQRLVQILNIQHIWYSIFSFFGGFVDDGLFLFFRLFLSVKAKWDYFAGVCVVSQIIDLLSHILLPNFFRIKQSFFDAVYKLVLLKLNREMVRNFIGY
jgi:hypothetical protein